MFCVTHSHCVLCYTQSLCSVLHTVTVFCVTQCRSTQKCDSNRAYLKEPVAPLVHKYNTDVQLNHMRLSEVHVILYFKATCSSKNTCIPRSQQPFNRSLPNSEQILLV